MFCKKNTGIRYTHQQRLKQSLKTSLFVLSLSAIASFGTFAKNTQHFNAEKIVFPNISLFTNALSDDKVEQLPEIGEADLSRAHVEKSVPPLQLNEPSVEIEELPV